MRTLKMIGGALGALTLSTLMLSAPAQAKPGDPVWTANGASAITGKNEVTLKGANTSVETANLNMEIAAATPVTFHYELADGATCSAGAPRVYLVLNGVNTNSWDQLIGGNTQCGEDGDVSFTVATPGTIKEAGVVYDNGTAGTVVVSDLQIGDELVNFRARVPGPPEPRDCEAYLYTGTKQNLCADFPNPPGKVNCSDVKYRVTLVDVKNDPWGLDGNQGTPGIGCESNPLKPTKPPKPTPKPTATATYTPAPPVPAPGAGGGLPVTGASGATLAGIGLGSLVLGLGAVLLARRWKARFAA
ncbi:hypothetical protein ACFOW4_16255 [Micromonospora sp. GCM10011542]|uniref:hypothetical protein n=1 Tax=Micromonospora sp. GCM10011542 TaxID=3317337 RepID=UPI00360EF2CC